MAERLFITDSISIGHWEIEFSYIRSSGPGGQNVNKVATAVQLRFSVDSSSLPGPVKARLKKAAGSRLNKDGVVVLTADRHRTQTLNRQDATDRLRALIASVATPPKRRRPTRPTLASKKRRLDAKSRRSTIKSLRGDPMGD